MLQVNIIGNCGHEVSEGETERLENAYNGFEEHRGHFLKEFSAAAVRRMLGMFAGVEWVARCISIVFLLYFCCISAALRRMFGMLAGVEWVARCSQGEKCSANSPLHHICLTTLLLCTTFFSLCCY